MTTSASVMTRDRISSALDGQLLVPGAAGYDDARSVRNALVDRRPDPDNVFHLNHNIKPAAR